MQAGRVVHNFLFHRVNPQRDPLWDPMDPSLFDRCISYITRRFTVVPFEQEALNGFQIDSATPLASVMFDDGYKDNIEYAVPILQKHRCPASFYIVTNGIETNTPTWTYLLDFLVYANPEKMELDFAWIPDRLKQTSSGDPKAKARYIFQLKQHLKTVTHAQRAEVLSLVQSRSGGIEVPKIMLNWNEVKQMRDAGFVIGSHTANHYMLGTLNDNGLVESELKTSFDAIQQNLGFAPVTISYPVGSYNALTIETSKRAGYRIGLAVKQRVYNPHADSVFEVPRIELYNEPWWKTRMRIDNTLERLKQLVGYKP